MTDSPKTRLARRLYEAGQVCCVPWEDLNPAVQATWIIKLEAVLECAEDLRLAAESRVARDGSQQERG